MAPINNLNLQQKLRFIIIATLLCAFYGTATAAQTRELPIFNPSFEDWNDSYPLSVSSYTTTIPTGWDLNRTGYAPCDAVVKTHSRCSARTGEYAAFFDSRSYSNALKSNTYKLSEGTYTFSVYAANIGYGGTKLTLKIEGAVNKSQQFSVTGSSYSYSKYSLSFNMENDGEVRFWIDNSKEWDGNTTISHFAIDDWSLTTSDGALLDLNSPNVYKDGNFTYYLYNNGTAELAIVNNKALSGEVSLPETISANSVQYILRSISPYAFSDCNSITSIILPKKLYTIGKNSFENCKSLNFVLFPTYLQSIGESAFKGCTNMHEAIFMTKAKPSLYTNTFEPQTQLYVPKISDYVASGNRVKGLAYINEDIKYTGRIPNLNFSSPSSVTVSSVNRESLHAACGNYTLPASFISHGMTVEGEIIVNIQPAVLNITAPNLTRRFGENNPQITLTYDGFVNGETQDALLIKPSISLDCNNQSDVGNYPILLSGCSASNYSINYNHGNLKIEKRNLIVRVDDTQIIYGEDLPQFQLYFTGLANFENAPKWDVSPQYITSAKKGSNVGEYSVSVNCTPHNYNVIEATNGNLLILKAPLTLKVNDVTREYFEENPEFGFSLVGLCNNDDSTCISVLPTYTCIAQKQSDCGEYSIIPSGATANNYNISYVNGLLTIQQANLLLSAISLSREYGESNPAFKYEAIGLKGQDDIITALINEPALSSTATESSSVGEYPISITGASSKNYTISYRQGILTIEKAPLVVIADNAERIYGDNNPAFTRSYTGFKLSDTENSAFSSLPRISCTASKISDVGEYTISIDGGTSRNYQISEYRSGVLTITKAPLILTATNKSRLYYEANPQFDFTLSGLRNNDTKSCISTIPTYSCSADMTSNAGEYSIIPSNAFAKNYNLEYNNGVLSVNQRPLTASVGNYTRKFNTENPSFEVSYTGFVNNEDASVLTSGAYVACNAAKTSDVGIYTLTPIGGHATNYVISKYNNGTLTIEKADQTISWEQDLSNAELYSQIALNAVSDAGLPVQYEMSPNNVATLYDNAGVWYLDCHGSGAVNIRAVQNGNKNYNAASMISKTLVVSGTGGDPSNPQIYLNVETAGTLPSMIAENRKYQIKNLRLTGNLNGTDINFLREMTGSDSYGNNTPGILETLDISGCTIVSGGRSYYKSCQTSNNKVGDYMFYNCKQLVNLMLPENTTEIEDYAFADCDRLSVISIPDGVKSFGVQSFRNDISLLRIPMPSGLIYIKDYAFIGCNGISEITIPASVTDIGDGIVKGCQNISKINVAEGNNHFASEDGVLYTSNFDKLLIFPVNYESNSYIVKDGTKSIAPYAFIDSKRLNEVTLPSTLTNIGEDAFIGCVNLLSLQVKALNPPVCYNDCFEAVSKTRCELSVPKGCYSYYWVAPVWSDFNKIKESDFNSSIDDVPFSEIKVYVENRNIVVNGVPENIQVRIFQVDGTLTYQVQSTGDVVNYTPAQSGIYIVVIANKTYKLMVH